MSSPEEMAAVRGILAGFGPNPVIVELGAHVGEEAQWIIPLCNHPKYVMVEPDPQNIRKIVNNLHYEYSLAHGAIGNHDEQNFEFYSSENLASNNRASGSIRKPKGHIEHFPEVTFTPIILSSLWTLDTLATAENLDHIDLLWCDIQGAERDMIEGGRATLAKTRYMMIEAEPEVELYEGQALKPELLAMLPDWVVLKDFGYILLMWNSKYV